MEGITQTAHRYLSERIRNSISLKPLSDDVHKFSVYLMKAGKTNTSMLKSDEKNIQAFATLNSIALSKLILFNRRRQVEVLWLH